MSAYTDSMVAQLEAQDEWTFAEAVAFAEANSLKPRSVIAKIKSLGLAYVPKPVVTKTGGEVIRKSEIVSRIEASLGVAVPSLAKATKADLEALAKAVA